MSTTDHDEKSTTESKPQSPAPGRPADKPALPDKIPEFPGDGGSGSGTTPTGQ